MQPLEFMVDRTMFMALVWATVDSSLRVIPP